MLLKIVYLLTCWLFGLAVLVARGDEEKDAELLVVRHEALVRREALESKEVRDLLAGLSQQPGRSWAQPDPGDAGEGGKQR